MSCVCACVRACVRAKSIIMLKVHTHAAKVKPDANKHISALELRNVINLWQISASNNSNDCSYLTYGCNVFPQSRGGDEIRLFAPRRFGNILQNLPTVQMTFSCCGKNIFVVCLNANFFSVFDQIVDRGDHVRRQYNWHSLVLLALSLHHVQPIKQFSFHWLQTVHVFSVCRCYPNLAWWCTSATRGLMLHCLFAC